MAEIDPEALLPNDRVRDAAVDGETFEVTAVEERTLGDLTDADARREGSASLEAYRRRMERVHPGDFEWDDESDIVTYRFERR